MKKFFKISGSIFTVLLIVFSILCVKSYFESKKPVISEGYYKDFKSSAELELKYSVPGPYVISSYIFDIDDINNFLSDFFEWIKLNKKK